MGERITKVEKFVRWCQNHKWISIAVIIGLIIIAIGDFTNALETICGLFKPNSPPISASNTNTPDEIQTKTPTLPQIAANTQTTNAPTATLEPSKIIDEIRDARPIQQEVLQRTFIGTKVRWLLKLSAVNNIGDSESLAQFRDGRNLATSSRFGTLVYVEISDEDKNLLRLSEKDALFYVSGSISKLEFDAVYLSNGKVEAYSADANIK